MFLSPLDVGCGRGDLGDGAYTFALPGTELSLNFGCLSSLRQLEIQKLAVSVPYQQTNP